jgi:hypothetical protein
VKPPRFSEGSFLKNTYLVVDLSPPMEQRDGPDDLEYQQSIRPRIILFFAAASAQRTHGKLRSLLSQVVCIYPASLKVGASET